MNKIFDKFGMGNKISKYNNDNNNYEIFNNSNFKKNNFEKNKKTQKQKIDQKYKKDKNNLFILSDLFLIKISLIFSLIGIILLFFLSSNSQLEIVTPSNINQYSEDEYIILKGTLSSYDVRGSISILYISEVVITNVIVFDNIDIDNLINETILINGVIRNNRGKNEIFASSIRIQN